MAYFARLRLAARVWAKAQRLVDLDSAGQVGHTQKEACEKVCCKKGGLYLVIPRGTCESSGGQPVADNECKGSLVCCAEAGGGISIATRGECDGGGGAPAAEEQCQSPATADSCTETTGALSGGSGVVTGHLSSAAGNNENKEECSIPYGFSGLAEGPEQSFEVLVPPGSRLVTTTTFQGFFAVLNVKAGCAAANPDECYGSSMGGGLSQPEIDLAAFDFSKASSIGMVTKAPGDSQSGSSSNGPAGRSAPRAPAAPVAMRVVVDSMSSDETVPEPIGLWEVKWSVVDGAPPNDTAEGATVLSDGVALHNESTALASDQYQSSGCPGVDDGAGQGTSDVFYKLTPAADGIYAIEAKLHRDEMWGDGFLAVLRPDGTCLGAKKANFRSSRGLFELDGGETYSIVFDPGMPAPTEVVFEVLAELHTGPAHARCSTANAIEALPFEAEADLSGGFNYFKGGSKCSYWLPDGAGKDTRRLVYTYTPEAEEDIEITLTALEDGFRPQVLVSESCVELPGRLPCADAFGLRDGQSSASIVVQMLAGVPYTIVVGSGEASGGRFRLELTPGTPNAPDTCAAAMQIPALDVEVSLHPRNLGDRFQGDGTAGADDHACGFEGQTAGEGERDAVFRFTAPADGFYVAELTSWGAGHVYVPAGACAEGLVDCRSQSTRDGKDKHRAYFSLTKDESATIIVDGWSDDDLHRDAQIVVRQETLPGNDSCDTATAISLPFEERSLLAFGGNAISLDTGSGCDVDSAGQDRAYVFDPEGSPTSLVAGLLHSDFDWSLYALDGCSDGANTACLAAASSGKGKRGHIRVDDVTTPLTFVVDEQTVPAPYGPGSYVLAVQSIATPPPYDTCEAAHVISEVPYEHMGNTVSAAVDYALADDGTSPCTSWKPLGGGPDVVHRLDITQELKDKYFQITFRLQPTFDGKLFTLINGCLPVADHCKGSTFATVSMRITDYPVGDQIFVVVAGTAEEEEGLYLLTVTGQ